MRFITAFKRIISCGLPKEIHLFSIPCSAILRVADYHWYGYNNVSDQEKAVQYYIQAAETKQPHVSLSKTPLYKQIEYANVMY